MAIGSRRMLRAFSQLNTVLALAAMIAGCAGPAGHEVQVQPLPADVSGEQLVMNGTRIGLLADVRLQTAKSMGTASTNGDSVVNVEIGPPARGFLAPGMLAYFLDQLVYDRRVDLILFLGNAANNGCEDELRRSFEILRDYRERRNIPIFFVIGNHDYLGAGYTPDTARRSIYCNDKAVSLEGGINKPIDKFELITMVHEFNTGNFSPEHAAQMHEWSYTHSYESARLKQACIVNDRLRHQHVKLGCYYAAKLMHRDGSEILLADTSDYYHKVPMSTFDIPVSISKWYGLTGWISAIDGPPGCDDLDEHIVPQAQWFHCHRAEKVPPVRIIAGHYPVNSLSPMGRKISRFSRLMCDISPMLQPVVPGGDYWLSADTHLRPYLIEEETDVRNCERYPRSHLTLRSLNIGSIVDYDWTPVLGKNLRYEKTPDMEYAVEYEPHAVVVTFSRGGDKTAGNMNVDKVIVDVRTCADVLRLLRTQPTADSPVYTRVMDSMEYKKLFGLDNSYESAGWTRYDQLNSRRNLEKLVDHLSGKLADQMRLRKIKACISLESARLAGSLQTRSFECETCPPWRIMRRIEDEKAAHY